MEDRHPCCLCVHTRAHLSTDSALGSTEEIDRNDLQRRTWNKVTSEQLVPPSFPRQWGLVLERHLWGVRVRAVRQARIGSWWTSEHGGCTGVRARLTVQGVVRPNRSRSDNHPGMICGFNSSTTLPVWLSTAGRDLCATSQELHSPAVI